MENTIADIRLLDIAENREQTYYRRRDFAGRRGAMSVNLRSRIDIDEASSVVGLILTATLTPSVSTAVDRLWRLRHGASRPEAMFSVRSRFIVNPLCPTIAIGDETAAIPPEIMKLMLSTTLGALRGAIAVHLGDDAPTIPLLDLDSLARSIHML